MRFVVALALLTSLPLATGAKPPYDRRTPVVEAFEANRDAVVSITSQQVRPVRDDVFSYGWDWPFSRPQYEVRSSLGSGFLVHEHGYVVTNAHVVARAVEISVLMADGSQYDAEPIKVDRDSDLAVLKIKTDEPAFPVVKLGPRTEPLIGETVIAIGNPYGYSHTVTDGIISAIHRDLPLGGDAVLPEMIQISAPINPGNSGGPLLNINGEVIGINTAIRQAAQGIGFAIPIDQLQDKLAVMLDIETLYRADFGLKVGDIPAAQRAEPNAGEDAPAGVVVLRVRPESAADRAGFQAGDIVTALDERPLRAELDFYLEMIDRPMGAEVRFSIWREGRVETLQLELVERPRPDGRRLAADLFGLEVMPLARQRARTYGLDTEAVAVRQVQRRSPADEAGIEVGDILLAVDGRPVADIDQLGLMLERVQAGATLDMSFLRVAQRGRWLQSWQLDRQLRARAAATAPGRGDVL